MIVAVLQRAQELGLADWAAQRAPQVSISDCDCDPIVTDNRVAANDNPTKSIDVTGYVSSKAVEKGKASVEESATSVPAENSAIPMRRFFRSTGIKSRINT